MGQDKEDLLRYRKRVQSLLSQFVPKGKSLDSMLEELAERWNPLFGTEERRDLVEDVNALVRDYIRPIRRSFLVRPPDFSRIHALAEQLSASKSLCEDQEEGGVDPLHRTLRSQMLRHDKAVTLTVPASL